MLIKRVTGLLILMILLLNSVFCTKVKDEKPNILIILADDQRFDTINALDSKVNVTPNIDKIVNDGVSFSNAHIMGSMNAAVCMPSRAMLASGKNLFSLQNSGRQIPADHILLGEYLRQNGYYTFGTGKWHNGPDAFNRAFCDGDAIFFGGMEDHWNVPLFHYDLTGDYKSTLPIIDNPWFSNKVRERKGEYVNSGVHSTDIFSDALENFLNHYNEKKPFFAYLAYTAPHDPRSMPHEYDLHADIPVAKNFLPQHPFDNGELKIRDEQLAGFPRQKEEIKRHLNDYYSMIAHIDDRIGKIITIMQERGFWDNSIVIFSSDNGLALGSHGLMGKQNLYEHSLRIPLIISGPGIEKNVISKELCYLYDLFPTLCELIDLPIPSGLQGKSLRAAVIGEEYKSRDELVFAYKNLQRAILTADGWKYIEYHVKGRKTIQLFDLNKDPLEMNNIAEKNKVKVQQLQKRMDEILVEAGDSEWFE